MDAPEIEQMALLERDHWWYRGLRDAISRTLKLPRFQLPSEPKVLDAGCGTGENLRLLIDRLQPAYAGGFDLSPLAVEWCRKKAGEAADVYVSDIRTPELHIDHLDLILSCDVISIPGMADSRAGLLRLIDRLREGGLFLLNVAAFQWLYSSHDVITHTRSRFTTGQIRRLFDELGLAVELITYRVFSLFPAIVLSRLPSMLRRPGLAEATSDLSPVPSLLASPLQRVLCAENWAMAHGVRFPWGSSVFAVGRKRSRA